MKKTVIAFIGLAAFAASTLAGCNAGGKKKPKKGPEPSEAAWKYAFNQAVYVGNNAANQEGENEVKPDEKEPAPFIALSLSNSVRPMGETDDYEFTYEYSYRVTVAGEEKNVNDYIEDSLLSSAFNQTVVQFKGWPANGASDTENFPRFIVDAKAKCNGWEQTKTYTMVLNPGQYEYKVKSLRDIYTKHASLNALSFMRQSSKVPGAYECDGATADDTHYNIETQGRLIYATEDGNWGILQDGDKYLQLYRLDALKIWDKIKDSLIGHDIWLKGNLGFGYGNIQMGNIKSILPVKSGDTAHAVTPPTSEKSFSEADISNHEWWNNTIFNAVGSISNATVTDGKIYSVVNASGGGTTVRQQVTNISSVASESSRYEFDVTVGSTTFIVATDYHANCGYDGKNSKGATTEAYTNWLKSLTPGKVLNIRGTIRWLNDRSSGGGNDYSIYTNGVWTITPYLSEHIA